MEILEKNMSEGQNEFKKPKPRPVTIVAPESNRGKLSHEIKFTKLLMSGGKFDLTNIRTLNL